MGAKVGEEAKDGAPEGIKHRLLELAVVEVEGGLQEKQKGPYLQIKDSPKT